MRTEHQGNFNGWEQEFLGQQSGWGLGWVTCLSLYNHFSDAVCSHLLSNIAIQSLRKTSRHPFRFKKRRRKEYPWRPQSYAEKCNKRNAEQNTTLHYKINQVRSWLGIWKVAIPTHLECSSLGKAAFSLYFIFNWRALRTRKPLPGNCFYLALYNPESVWC